MAGLSDSVSESGQSSAKLINIIININERQRHNPVTEVSTSSKRLQVSEAREAGKSLSVS